jgi:hypothetical protein
VEFKGDFFAAHPLEAGEFWVGDWHHARDENEKHLHGETYYYRQDFERVNGYDERILSYGQDDTNLKDRLVLSGLTKKTINNDFLNHQEHDDVVRTSNQTMLHPMVRTYAHRLFVNNQPLYSIDQPLQAFAPHSADEQLVVFNSTDLSLKAIDHGAGFEDAALNIVAGWYGGNDIASLSREEKIKLVWQHSCVGKSASDGTMALDSEAMPTKRLADEALEMAGVINTASLFSSKHRILILGSSVSIQKEGYLPSLKVKLDSLCEGGHEYLNASLGGTPSEATNCYVQANLVYDIEKFAPTVALVEKTPNDKIFDFSLITPEQRNEKLGNIEKHLTSLVKSLQSRNCIVVLISMFTKPDGNLNWLRGSALNYLSSIYSRVANAANSVHVNVAEYIAGMYSDDQGCDLLLDEVHLSRTGSDVVANFIFSQISALRKSHGAIGTSGTSTIKHEGTHTKLAPLLEGREQVFKNSLLEVQYNIINLGAKRQIDAKYRGELVGLFYINDPYSGWIKITTDLGHSTELKLFDHFSFMPRLHYRSLPALAFECSATLEVIDKEIDYAMTVDSYNKAKTFDPKAAWAINKYLDPLMNAIENKDKLCFKPVLLMASLDN